eukprot:5059784-Ditylum_brightwellii.AAC.1
MQEHKNPTSEKADAAIDTLGTSATGVHDKNPAAANASDDDECQETSHIEDEHVWEEGVKKNWKEAQIRVKEEKIQKRKRLEKENMSNNRCSASQDNKESSSGSEYRESKLENDTSSNDNADVPRKGIDPDNDILHNGEDASVERSAKARQAKDPDGLTDSALQKSKQPNDKSSTCVKDPEGNHVASLLHFYQSGWTLKWKEHKVLLQPGEGWQWMRCHNKM